MLVPSDTLRRYLEIASKNYHSQLFEGTGVAAQVAQYLQGRGITQEAARQFRLGVVVDPEPGHENYLGCISIPYLTPSRSVTAIRFRKLEGEPKYLSTPGDIHRIYNTAALERGTRAICITEGEFDCIIAESCGLPTIGAQGANGWKDVFYLLVDQYDAVYMLADDDEAGKDFAYKLQKRMDSVRPVLMKGGDVTTFYLEHGAEALRRKVGVK